MPLHPQKIPTPSTPIPSRAVFARPYVGEADVQPIVDLINTCFEADGLDRRTTREAWQASLRHPSLDLEHDVQIWDVGDRQRVAYAQLWIDENPTDRLEAYLTFQIHPRLRDTDLPHQVIAWAERRLQQVGQERQVPVALRGSGRASETERLQWLERNGFVADRWFQTLGRSLVDRPIDAPQIPEGFTIRSVQPIAERSRADVAAWVEMFNQSFIDHWNHQDLTLADAYHELEEAPDYRADLDLVAIAPDGTLAGFCVATIHVPDNHYFNRHDGWINLLGTRRGFRRRGLGRALLLSGLQRLHQAGMDFAKLGVDSQNPNHAYVLYESVGFRPLYTSPSLLKPLHSQ